VHTFHRTTLPFHKPSTIDWTKRSAADQSTAVHRFAAIKRMNYAADNALGILKDFRLLRHFPPTCCLEATEETQFVAF
jgi:hypothetical protein